jgi:hypothetical protein
VSYTDLLISTCDIKRFTDGPPDPYGQPVKSWSTILSGTPCRLVATGGKEITQGIKIVIADYRLFLGNGIDITEQDRVTVDGKSYEVLLIDGMQDANGDHHTECDLFSVR